MLVTLWRSSIPSRVNSSTPSCSMLTYINRIEIQSCGPLAITSRLWSTCDFTFYLPYICLLNFSSDVDECATDTHNCSRDGGKCNNTKGSYKCQCKPGFTGDGRNCSDIDECAKDTHNCSRDGGECNNTKGSYKCQCKPGFTGDGRNCSDIDECAKDTHNCSRDGGECNNTKGSYKCQCKPGFAGDGHNCTGEHAYGYYILLYLQYVTVLLTYKCQQRAKSRKPRCVSAVGVLAVTADFGENLYCLCVTKCRNIVNSWCFFFRCRDGNATH